MFFDCTKCPVTLETFCDKESERFDLALPFRRSGNVYATDGRIVVRVPATHYDGPLALATAKTPNPEDFGWDKEVAVASWDAVPEPLPCEDCKDQRGAPYQVPDDDGYYYDESIRVTCPHCRIVVQGVTLAWHLVEPLTRFGDNLECGVGVQAIAVHFRFDGGYALVMPLK